VEDRQERSGDSSRVSNENDAESNSQGDGALQEAELWEKIESTHGVERAEVLAELSHFAYSRDDYTTCLQLVETSLDLYRTSDPNATTSPSTLHQLVHLHEGKAFSHRKLQQHREAAAAFQEIARLQKDRDNFEGHVQAIRAAGCDWYAAKEWEKSLACHREAQSAIDPDANDGSRGVDALNIGMSLSKLERYEEAVASFLQARNYFKATKDPSDVHHVDFQITLAYIALGNGPEAKFYAKHEFNYAKVAENFTAEGVARMHLGKAHALCGDYEEAEAQLVRALEMLTVEERKDWEDIIEANRALADVLTALGRTDEAQERLEQLATIEETWFIDLNADNRDETR